MPQETVPHLPTPIMPATEYKELYAFNHGMDSIDFSENEWQEIR